MDCGTGQPDRGEDVVMTSAFLSKGLLLYVLHVFAMFLMEHHSLEVFWAPASLMALKQAALDAWIEWPLFVLASITAMQILFLASRTDCQ